MTRRILITGAPCGGKTSIINALKALGHMCMPEAARLLIEQQLQSGGTLLPWVNLSAFQLKVVELQKDMHQNSPDSLVFFDRGLPDGPGYLQQAALPISPAIRQAIMKYRYDEPVFFTPFWDEIYTTDGERKEEREKARHITDCIREAYYDAGYDLVDLPFVPVEERVRLILGMI